MRTTASLLSAAALVGLAAASPAPQQLDFDQLAAAPTIQTAPILNGISNQTVTISSSAIAKSISAAVSTQATAVATAPAAVVNKAKRDVLEKRTLGFFSNLNCQWFGIFCENSNTATTSTSSTVKSTSSSTISSGIKAYSSSVPASTSAVRSSSASSVAPSSSSVAVSASSSGSATINTASSGTSTTSSTTACPTTPEDGTYCGFINPEDPCAPQPDGYGPKVDNPDTASAFLAYAPFHSMASAAPTVVASNNVAGNAYQQTFRDLNASSSANSYLGLYTLSAYNVSDCAAHCDSTALCTAFNIYIERDPSQNPSKNDSTDPTVWGYWCPNPSSITNYKCTLWGSNLDAVTATNQGGWRKDFEVVVTGSNGYDATNVTFPPVVVDTVDNTTSTASVAVSSVLSTATASSSIVKASSTSSSAAVATATGATWSTPKTCNSKAINAPNYWMGSKFFPGPFNPQVCADYASYQHVLNKRTAIAAGKSYFTPCNSFNAYYLHKNGIPHGTYCALYDASISTSYATYTGGWSGSNKYDCRQSYQYTRQTLDQGRC